MSTVSFGIEYTHRKTAKEIFVENKGRKPQKLEWVRKAPDKKNRGMIEDKKGKNDKGGASEEENFVFDILPSTLVLPPKHGIMF